MCALTFSHALNTTKNAVSEPTDRSMPPVMIANVSPIARIPNPARSIPSGFCRSETLANSGFFAVNAANTTISAMMIPISGESNRRRASRRATPGAAASAASGCCGLGWDTPLLMTRRARPPRPR